jgi:ubiquinone/menaquinone biosynthesis C-methylase UbiE
LLEISFRRQQQAVKVTLRLSNERSEGAMSGSATTNDTHTGMPMEDLGGPIEDRLPGGNSAYPLDRSDSETRRLIMQAELFDKFIRRLLEDAGLARGMRVLDVGSGGGDVAFAAADIVGPTGAVVGVDVDPSVLSKARARAEKAGRDNVAFVEGDCRSSAVDGDFDAVVGRLVLMYVGDVVETLRSLVARVRPGGIVAFAEADFTPVLGYVHAGGSELLRTCWEWGTEAFRRVGAHTAMAPILCNAFIESGLGEPHMVLHAPLGCHSDWTGYDWMAESIRSLLPVLENFDIATDEVVDVATLARRFRADVVRTRFPLMLVPLVGAWARKPTDEPGIAAVGSARPTE